MSVTFAELAIEKAPKQEEMVDFTLEESPILASIPMEAATNGIQNVYEELKMVEGAQFVGLDSELPSMGIDSELKYTDLSVLGGEIFAPEDRARILGGAEKYFTKRLGPILKDTGSRTEKSIIYNNFRAFAKTNSNLLNAGGTNDGNMFSMIAVKWVRGENTGLYDETGFGTGSVFDIAKINGGELYKDVDTKLLGFGMRLKTYIGIQLANPDGVAGIANIDLAIDENGDYTNLPPEAQVDDMLDRARADASNTFIYCHPKLLKALGVYKGAALNMVPGDKNFNRMIAYWDDIMFVTSRNFETTESTEVFA